MTPHDTCCESGWIYVVESPQDPKLTSKMVRGMNLGVFGLGMKHGISLKFSNHMEWN